MLLIKRKNKKWRIPYYTFNRNVKGYLPFGKNTLMCREAGFVGFVKGMNEDIVRTDYIGKPKNHEGHVVCVGGTGSGKSTGIVMPALEKWDEPILSIDIKGELTNRYKQLLAEGKVSRPYKVINLLATDDELVDSYDPYYILHKADENYLVQYARELAQSIITMPHDERDKFWKMSAQHALTAVILYYYALGANFNETMTAILTIPLGELIEQIAGSTDPKFLIARMHLTHFLGCEDLSDSKMLAGISAELCNGVMVLASDPTVRHLFTPSENCIVWSDLETHNIFICINEDRLEQWGSVITLILTQLIRSLERRPDKFSMEGQALAPVLLLLDEFPRLGKLDVIANAFSTLRSKKITICLMIQSLAQLDAIYGKDCRRIIIDNCDYKVILRVTDADSQKYFSELVGTRKSWLKGFGANIGIPGFQGGLNAQANESREPLIYPHEFATRSGIVLIAPTGVYLIEKAPYYVEV